MRKFIEIFFYPKNLKVFDRSENLKIFNQKNINISYRISKSGKA
jgi:hypothetical protein